MHLGNGGRSQGFGVYLGKHVFQRLVQLFLNQCPGLGPGKWFHVILQAGQFGGDGFGDHVGPGGQHLAELDKNRAQFFQRPPQLFRRALTASGPGAGGRQDFERVNGVQPLAYRCQVHDPPGRQGVRDARKAGEVFHALLVASVLVLPRRCCNCCSRRCRRWVSARSSSTAS